MRKKRIRSTSGNGLTLGLAAFAKISAVEGLKVSPSLRRDLESLDRQRLTPEERTHLIARKYGKASA